MSPTAIYVDSTSPAQVQHQNKGPALVVGSLTTASAGSFQQIVGEVEQGRSEVDKLMVDRVLEGATTLPPAHYTAIHVVLSAPEYDTFTPKLSLFLSSLAPSGIIHIHTPPGTIPSELTIAGCLLLTPSGAPTLMAQKPSAVSPVSLKLNRKKTDPAAKKALWALSPSSSPAIDAEALLTEADKQRPAPCEPANPNAPRRKRACKNCTCGLKELEEEEERNAKVVVFDGDSVKEMSKEERQKLVNSTAKATSSCGNCFLGDAFRCAGCPYRGLPAFKPGEKVEIDSLVMDDI